MFTSCTLCIPLYHFLLDFRAQVPAACLFNFAVVKYVCAKCSCVWTVFSSLVRQMHTLERERERPLGSVKLRSNCWVGVQVYFHFMFFVKIPFSLWSCCYWLKYSSIAEDFVFQVLKWKWGVVLHVDQTSLIQWSNMEKVLENMFEMKCSRTCNDQICCERY